MTEAPTDQLWRIDPDETLPLPVVIEWPAVDPDCGPSLAVLEQVLRGLRSL
jgi:hypothetical protein